MSTAIAYSPKEGSYDEMFEGSGTPRAVSGPFVRRLSGMTSTDLQTRQSAADLTMVHMGITFAVYGHQAGTEKVWPFDILPRIVSESEWLQVERGLKQRIHALNLFIDDVYNDGKILRDKIVPEDLVLSAKTYRAVCRGFRPPHGVWCHVTGTDLVRDKDGQFYVLEDNLRCPSGVSYVLENREVMKRTFPQVFGGMSIVPVEDYPERLLEMLQATSPTQTAQWPQSANSRTAQNRLVSTTPTAVLLTPGRYNSAYFEHSFLAQQMGIDLVQGEDLMVQDGWVWKRTTRGLQRVDAIYRRIDDDFIDPQVFRPDSMLGVPGLMEVYRAGRVTLANAPGTGIADDKAVYAYVPQIIKYYLNEDPIIANVPTYICDDPTQCDHVLQNLDKLVVKPTNESGGYGILMGPQASAKEREETAERIRANPRNYIAQPMLQLSTVPTLVEGKLEARHVDLRPFVLYSPGASIYVLPGGLTRVALRKGSMIVNSSQGGGSKDTWVLRG